MQKYLIILAAVFFIGCPHDSESQDRLNGGVKWESFNSGLAKAKSQKKPVIIDFYADWCHWCKVMDSETFTNKDVAKILRDSFIAVRLDMEKAENISYMGMKTSTNKFASALGVRGLPSIAFMDKDGNLIDLVPGFIKPEIFVGILRYINEGCYKMQVSFEDYMNKKADCK